MKTKMISQSSDTPPLLTNAQREHLAQLAAFRNQSIDTTDIPELTNEVWSSGAQGRFYRPNAASDHR